MALGPIYVWPAEARDRLTWSRPPLDLILVMEPRFLARSLEDTAHLKDVELTAHWNLRDRHIEIVMLALHADLEDVLTGRSALRRIARPGARHLSGSAICSVRNGLSLITAAACLRRA